MGDVVRLFRYVIRPVVVAAMLMSGAGCRLETIRNIENHPITTINQKLSDTEVRAAIIEAGSQRGWVFEQVGPNRLRAVNDVRGKHSVAVQIRYDESSYDITYESSDNMKVSGDRIHPKYNTWVRKLSADIDQALQRRGGLGDRRRL